MKVQFFSKELRLNLGPLPLYTQMGQTSFALYLSVSEIKEKLYFRGPVILRIYDPKSPLPFYTQMGHSSLVLDQEFPTTQVMN